MPLISNEARTVVNLINEFGCLTIQQIRKIFQNNGFPVKPMISYLCKSRQIMFLEDNYAVMQHRPVYSPEKIDCVWVMLDLIKKEDIFRSDELSSASPCDNGIEVCFINDGKTITYITFVDVATSAKISMIQDTFYTTTGTKPGNESKSNRHYVFAIRDDRVMDTLADMKLTIPFTVALISGELTDIPTIEYYKPEQN